MKKIFKNNYFIYLILICSSFFLDQITKTIIENNIVLNNSINILGNFLRFTFIHNDGAAFGIFSGKSIYLILFSLVIVLFILYQYICYKDSKLLCYSFSVLLGGLLGNLTDRIMYGYVRDFIHFKIFKFDAPIFNISDIFIVLSIFVIIYGVSKYEGKVVLKDEGRKELGKPKNRSNSSRRVKKKQK